jgi:hypothetical protein
MAMKGKAIGLGFGLILLMAPFGCDTRYITTAGGGGGTTEYWLNFEKQGDGTVRFYTNDRSLLGVIGSAHWKIGTVPQTPMTEYTVTAQKLSGSPQGGYGVVFSASDKNHFLTVLIDTTQHYKVGKYSVDFSNEHFRVIKDWTVSTELNGGYVANTIRVALTAPNQYRVYFNNDASGIGFEDEDDPPYTGGYFGYVAEVHTTDDFPEVPVDVSFTQVEPVDIGM